MQAFTDDYSSTVFVFFLNTKNDTVKATERLLADVAPCVNVRCVRTDNGTEFTGKEFQALLNKQHKTRVLRNCTHHIKQHTVRKRGTLFNMARCMVIDSNLPKELWMYAVVVASVIPNRCLMPRRKKNLSLR